MAIIVLRPSVVQPPTGKQVDSAPLETRVSLPLAPVDGKQCTTLGTWSSDAVILANDGVLANPLDVSALLEALADADGLRRLTHLEYRRFNSVPGHG